MGRKRSPPGTGRSPKTGGVASDAAIAIRSSMAGARTYPEQAVSGIRMDLNMNIVLPPPDLALAAARFPLERASEYPSQDSSALREALARKFRVDPDMVVAANGSNEIIDYSMRAFVEPAGEVHTVEPSFSMYGFFARTNSTRLVTHLLRDDFSFDPRPLAKARGARIIPTPNNPTGNRFGKDQVVEVVEAAARRKPADVVLIDEAYAEYCGQDFTPLARKFPNVVCLRTFSKVYGLAGLRVGYAIASPPAARMIAKVRPPFALSALAEHFALAMLSREDYVSRVVAATVAELKRMASSLQERGFQVFPSDANFLLARVPKWASAPRLVEALARRGIAIKDFSKVARLENTVRITVGSREIGRLFLEALDSALGSRVAWART